ncbi:ZFP3 protein, partial [Formicarius rufipectus]|nr:ZFP3 protein [Formicarius rufipectus]
CQEDGRSFSGSSDLMVTVQFHPWEKPYRCFECGQSFRQIPALFFHQRVRAPGST